MIYSGVPGTRSRALIISVLCLAPWSEPLLQLRWVRPGRAYARPNPPRRPTPNSAIVVGSGMTLVLPSNRNCSGRSLAETKPIENCLPLSRE